jgi:hypothetical protein
MRDVKLLNFALLGICSSAQPRLNAISAASEPEAFSF